MRARLSSEAYGVLEAVARVAVDHPDNFVTVDDVHRLVPLSTQNILGGFAELESRGLIERRQLGGPHEYRLIDRSHDVPDYLGS